MKRLFLSLLVSVGALAAVVVTGPRAQAIYDGIQGPVRGPFCTGACFPGQPCDPTCTSFKSGSGWRCSKTEHTRTGAVDYRCEQ